MSHGLLQTNPWVTVSCLKEDVYLFPFNLNFPTVVIGKTEGVDKDWHGHVSALTVGSEFRRLGLAESLMLRLEKNSELSVTEETMYFNIYMH